MYVVGFLSFELKTKNVIHAALFCHMSDLAFQVTA